MNARLPEAFDRLNDAASKLYEQNADAFLLQMIKEGRDPTEGDPGHPINFENIARRLRRMLDSGLISEKPFRITEEGERTLESSHAKQGILLTRLNNALAEFASQVKE